MSRCLRNVLRLCRWKRALRKPDNRWGYSDTQVMTELAIEPAAGPIRQRMPQGFALAGWDVHCRLQLGGNTVDTASLARGDCAKCTTPFGDAGYSRRAFGVGNVAKASSFCQLVCMSQSKTPPAFHRLKQATTMSPFNLLAKQCGHDDSWGHEPTLPTSQFSREFKRLRQVPHQWSNSNDLHSNTPSGRTCLVTVEAAGQGPDGKAQDSSSNHRYEHPLRLRQVEAIEIHHLVPRGHEVAHEHLLRIVTSVNFRVGSELGV